MAEQIEPCGLERDAMVVTNYYCPNCAGTGYVSANPDSTGPAGILVCPVCHGKRILSSEDRRTP